MQGGRAACGSKMLRTEDHRSALLHGNLLHLPLAAGGFPNWFLLQVRPSLLGTSCESGIVSFWDCNASKNLFNLAPHCR